MQTGSSPDRMLPRGAGAADPARGLPPTHESWLPNEHSLYRPRHGRRQRLALVAAVVFFLAPALAFTVGVRPTRFENRALAEFPAPGSGWGFFTGLLPWGTDNLPLREGAVRAGDAISAGVFGDEPRHDAAGPERTAAGFPIVIRGKEDWLYLGTDASNKCRPKRTLDEVFGALRELRDAVESSGRRFVLVAAPDKSTAVPRFLPDEYAGKSCSTEVSARFWARATTEADVIDLRPALDDISTRSGRMLWDANDSHWTYEGGMAMTYAIADRISPGVTSTWLVGDRQETTWPADIIPLLGDTAQRSLRTYTLAPDGVTDRSKYVKSDFRTPLSLIQPQPGLPGTVVPSTGFIADSFTQFASPFLAAAFRDLTIVHPETVAAEAEQSAKELLVSRDVLVLELAERNLASGVSPVLDDEVINALVKVLANHPR